MQSDNLILILDVYISQILILNVQIFTNRCYCQRFNFDVTCIVP